MGRVRRQEVTGEEGRQDVKRKEDRKVEEEKDKSRK